METASLPSDLVRLHCHNKRTTAQNWARYASHRRQVTELLRERADTELMILGAGNCNDVDLPLLANDRRRIHLVDLDRASVRAARNRLPGRIASSVILHAPVDVSGSLGELPRFRRPGVTANQLASFPKEATARVVSSLPGNIDTVISDCVLSQMMHTAAVELGVEHPLLQILACAMAVAHLRALVQLLSP